MNRKILPALLLHFALAGCVPSKVHEQTVRRNQELERQVNAVQATLRIVQLFTVVNGGLLAVCLVALWNRGRKEVHERTQVSNADYLRCRSHRGSDRLHDGQVDRALPGRSRHQADGGRDSAEHRRHNRTHNRNRHSGGKRHHRKRRAAGNRSDSAEAR